MKRIFAVLLILSALMVPTWALAAELPDDGEYTIEARLTGGSGRAYVESPTALTVKDGVGTAVIVWSSPFYEYMRIGETVYDPIQEEGNATFEIPITLDEDIPVAALTVAMSEPHEIEYSLRFDSSTIKPVGRNPQPAVYIVLGCAAAAAIIAAVLVMRRKRGNSK